MKIFSNSIHNGQFDKAMGKFGTQVYRGKMPSRSFHLAWQDLPKNTKSLALTFLDYDAIPVCGFCWIHWTVANIAPSFAELPENASVEGELLQGVNSWASGIVPEEWHLSHEEATAFGGCAPPDKPHVYTIELYALDKKLDLKSGFYMNDLLHAMKGHVLAKAALEAEYPHE